MVVDDDRPTLNLIAGALEDDGYEVIDVTDGLRALETLQARAERPDIILLDLLMPGLNGYEVCKKIKTDPETQMVPVIFISSMNDVDDEAKGFDVGAVDYIHKPISVPVLLRRVQTHLSLVRSQDLEKSYEQSIFMLGEAGHYNDTDTGVHIWRMAAYAGVLAAKAGWPKHLVKRLELASPMHDTGKIGIPDAILKAPRKLTHSEMEVMKRHAEIGFGILSKSDGPIFKMAAQIARHHHEMWNGSGYPCGLAGEAIPEPARIVAVADVFDALTMKRPYKAPWSVDASVAEIVRLSGTHFEPRIVELFVQCLPEVLSIMCKMEDRSVCSGPQPFHISS